MFTDSSLEVLLIDRDIPLHSFSLLIDLAADPCLDLSLILVYDSFVNGEFHNGFAFSTLFNDGVDVPSLLCFQYLRDVPLTLYPSTVAPPAASQDIFVFDPPVNGSILRSMNILAFVHLDNFLASISGTGASSRDIFSIIRSYVSSDFDFWCFSTAKQEILYNSAFIVVKAPSLSDKDGRTLYRSVHFSGRRRYRSRRHQLFAQSDQFAYWWDDLEERPPFISRVYPSPLLRWRSKIESLLPQISGTPHCLLASYERGSDQLSLHSDCELRDFLGDFELVILTFLGGSRDLVIRSNSRRSRFSRVITCSQQIMVIMTPFGNRHFLHGKLPSRAGQHPRAATLAFRKAIGFAEAVQIYPSFSQHITPIGPEGVHPITPEH